MRIAWGRKVSKDVLERAIAIATSCGGEASWLLACMAFETGRTFDPAKRNAASGATGLIQFMPLTARGLGTSTDELAAMDAGAQMNFVAAYFAPFAGKLRTLSDFYMAILYPKAIGAGEDDVIFAPGSREALQNRGLDIDHDNAVTKREAAGFVAAALEEGLRPENVLEYSTTAEDHPMPLLLSLLPAVLELFHPLVSEKFSKLTGSPVASEKFVTDLFAKAQELTSTSSPIAAVAALQAAPAAPAVQQLEDHVVDQMAAAAPLLEQLAKLDQARWAADQAGADAAGTRGRADKYDIAPRLVSQANQLLLAAIAFLAIALCVQMYFSEDHKPDSGLAALFGVIVYAVARMGESPFRYRFGGQHDSAAADMSSTVITNNTTRKP